MNDVFPQDEAAIDPTVTMLKADEGLRFAVRRLLDAIYGGEKPWTEARAVLIKPNVVNFEPHVYVEPRLLGALVATLRKDGVKHVAVMESGTNGGFTRLAFRITGMDRAVRAAGGHVVYLDEGRSVTINLGEAGDIELSRFLNDTLLTNREDYFYINLAKLKTHAMTTVSLCLKNQWAFVDPACRGRLHNNFLHQSIHEVYRLFTPDLCLIEALTATNHGHFPLRGFEAETLWPAGVLLGGRDAVAVDAAACQLVGIDPWQVEHLARCMSDPAQLTPPLAKLDELPHPPAPFTDKLLPFWPEDIVLHRGRELCCKEGCGSNPVCAVQVLAANYGGQGGFHLFLGKGHASEIIDACPGPALVVGPCAKEEVYDRLVRRLGARQVRFSPDHNNLKETIRHLMQLMKVKPFKVSPLPFRRVAALYLRHLLAGSRADIGYF